MERKTTRGNLAHLDTGLRKQKKEAIFFFFWFKEFKFHPAFFLDGALLFSVLSPVRFLGRYQSTSTRPSRRLPLFQPSFFSHVVAFAKNDVNNNETVAFLLPYLRRVKSKPTKRTRTGAAGAEL